MKIAAEVFERAGEVLLVAALVGAGRELHGAGVAPRSRKRMYPMNELMSSHPP